jgi:hypothetical protein
MRCDIPDGGHRKAVDLAHLGQRDEPAVAPVTRLDPLPVNPVGGIGVAADLEVFAELLVADGTALRQQLLDLLEHERVALDSGRVMGLLEPDPPPDDIRLVGRGEPAEPVSQFADRAGDG